MGKLLGTLGKGIIRAFTKDGGSLLKLKGSDLEKIDSVWAVAFALRTLITFVLLWLVATWLGVDPTEFLQAFKDFSG